MAVTQEQLRQAAEVQKKELLRLHPALGFIPNIGQERALSVFKERVPYISIFGGGNGVGKTTALAILAVGLCFGPDELHEFFDSYAIFPWFRDKCIRRGRPALGRIICHADSMKSGGALLQVIQQWFPPGKYKLNKNGKTYYSEIVCDNGSVIDIKTHDQGKGGHSGTTLDFVLEDEPSPEDLWGETVGRTRDGGFIAFFLTPLELAGWMLDNLIDVADGKEIVVTNASIWDNCKDIPGTRGHLERENIERMIRQWERQNPEEVNARVNGLFTHLSGAIYKIFSPEVHIIPPPAIPSNWPVYQVIDPHDARPPAVAWFAQGPHGIYGFREWPYTDYTKLSTTTHTISQCCEEFRRIEAPFTKQVKHRLMDPNKAEYEYPNTKLTVQKEYAKEGFSFTKSDDNIDIGHKRVNELLHYDFQKPVTEFNRPQLYVAADCPNLINALRKYGYKKVFNEGAAISSKLDQKYKDFADLVRYMAVKLKPYRAIDVGAGFWDTIKGSR